MKKCTFIILLLMQLLIITACSGIVTSHKEVVESKDPENISIDEENTQKEESAVKMKLEIGKEIFTVVLAENSSVDALKKLLEDGPLTLTMTDYAGMEKCVDLGIELPQNNVQMNTQAGDIILYQGRTLAIYYGTNSWSLTPIGKIENVNKDKLYQALGPENVTVKMYIE